MSLEVQNRGISGPLFLPEKNVIHEQYSHRAIGKLSVLKVTFTKKF